MLRIGTAAWRSSQGFASARLTKVMARPMAPSSSSSLFGFGNPRRHGHPFGGQSATVVIPVHGLHLVRFNSTSAPDPANASSLTDVSSVIDPNAVATLAADVAKLGDLHALGLGSYYTPVGWVQNILEFLHVSVDLPWWGAIVALTLTARTLLFPAIIGQLKNSARLNNIRPEMENLTALMNTANKAGDKVATNKYSMELKKLFKKHECSPFRGLMMPLVQAPIFVSFFLGIRKMAELPLESMKTGGLSWFTDLTVMDPYYILPVMSAATFLLTIELGTDGISPQQQGQMKKVFRGLAVIMIPMTYSLPSGIFVYWMTTNVFSLCQFALLKTPGIKEYFNIPTMIKHKDNPNIKRPGFFESLKTNYESQVEKQKEANRLRKIEEERAAEIAAGPPVIYTNKQKKSKSRSQAPPA